MIKSALALVIAAGVASSAVAAQQGGKSCCAMKAAGQNSSECISFANLSLNADQKSKLESWQKECMQSGCTRESHKAFLKKAKGVLSAEQFTALKKDCGAMKEGKAAKQS